MKAKNYFLLLLMGVMSIAQYAQGQNPLWSLPPNYYNGGLQPLPIPTGTTNAPNDLDFPMDYYDGFSAKGSSCAIADVHNELSFFVIDGLIYDKDGKFVDLAFQDNQNQWDYAPTTSTICGYSVKYDGFMIGQETMIIPTSDCNRFVIVSSFSRHIIPFSNPPEPGEDPTGLVQLRALPVYCIYDAQTKTVLQRGPWYGGSNGSGINDYTTTQMNPNNSVPIFTEQSTSNPANTNGDSPFTVAVWGDKYLPSGLNGFAASDINPDGSRFLVTIVGNAIVVVKLESNGNLRYWKRFLVNYGLNLKRSSELELVFNPITNRFQLAYSAGNFSEFITYCEFSSDFLTMTSSQQAALPYSEFSGFYGTSGLEFSQNNNYLYFTCDVFHNQTPNFPDRKLGYLDIGNDDYTVFNLPVSFVPNTSSPIFNASFLELNSSGNFLLSGANGLYQISNPNNPNLLTINYSPTVPLSIESTIGCLQTEYFNTKYYPLPDQIDGMDYSARFTQNLQCCLDSRDYGMTTYNATGTDVWNSASDINGLSLTGNTVIVKDELRIKAGSVITIKNMTFKFAPGARVVIEQGGGVTSGGKLIMDNSTFTKDDQCTADIYWLGVEVQGNGHFPQTSVMNTTQGILMMKNNSVIEYAQIGALVAQRAISIQPPAPNNLTMLTAQLVALSGGGIVQASNSTFRNNFMDVKFESYHYLTNLGTWQNNFSIFGNCTFITTPSFANYPILNAGPTHVQLNDVKGIGFVSCDFLNSTPYGNFPKTRGIGIVSRNAIYSVNSFCGLNCTNNNGTFTDLYFGIRAFSTGFPTLSVDKQDFINNTYGIDLEGPDLATITNNHFEVSRKSSISLIGVVGSTYGLYLNACTGYHVENNDFTSFNDANISASNANTYGVVVNNSGTAHNEIYRNTFTELKVGTQAQGVNAYTPTPPILIPIFAPTYGLQFKCNHYLKSIYEADIAVTSGKIDPNQGLISFSFPNPSITNAGNLFSHSGPSIYDFYAAPSVPTIKYVHTNDTQSTPINYTSQINPLNSGQTRNSNTCPSKIYEGVIVGPIRNHFLRLKTDSLKIAILDKESLFDGGNTSDLLGAIATQSEGDVKNTLMTASPYLTDTVLSSYLGSNPPNGNIKEVAVVNSPLTPQVYSVITAMNLPHGIQKQIDKAQVGISARNLLENEIAYLEATRSDLINERIRQFIFDTISPSPFDSIAVILKTEGISINNKKRLFDTYCAMPDSGRAAGTRDTIVQMGDASNFAQLADIHLEMLSCTCPGGLNDHPNLIDGLQAIASDANDRISAVKAQCMLSLVSDSLFLPIVEDINTGGTQGMGLSNSGSMGSNEAASALSIYPNPTNNGTIVTIALDSKDETLTNSTIEVYSITGQLMLKQAFEGEAKSLSLQPGALHPGVYFVKLISEGAIIETKKLLVER